MALTHRESFSGVKIINGGWKADISEAVTSADISLTTGEVSQLTISADDPGYEFFRRHNIPLNTWVEYDGLKFSVAAIDLNEGGGEGGFTLTCRPRAVRLLKDRKGKKTMKNVSPSQFVIAECKAAGIKYKVQASARRSSVSRDVPEKGSDEEANSWTTIGRLADELKFDFYESEGTVYFGQTQWLAKQRGRVSLVTYSRTNKGTDITNLPDCNISLDNNKRRIVTFDVPVERRKEFQPGGVVWFNGIPAFGGAYVITSMEFPLAGEGELTMTIETFTGVSLTALGYA